MEEGNGRNTGSPAGGVARANRQPTRARSGRTGWRRGPYYRRSRVMPVEGRDLRWKRWRKGAGSREWPNAYDPDERAGMLDVITCISEGDDPCGRRRQGVSRPDDGPAGRREGASLVPRLASPPAGCDRAARVRAHDSTGEPGAGNRHAGFGERGEETCPRNSDCGPARKRRMSHRLPTGYAPPLDSTDGTALGQERNHQELPQNEADADPP